MKNSRSAGASSPVNGKKGNGISRFFLKVIGSRDFFLAFQRPNCLNSEHMTAVAVANMPPMASVMLFTYTDSSESFANTDI